MRRNISTILQEQSRFCRFLVHKRRLTPIRDGQPPIAAFYLLFFLGNSITVTIAITAAADSAMIMPQGEVLVLFSLSLAVVVSGVLVVLGTVVSSPHVRNRP